MSSPWQRALPVGLDTARCRCFSGKKAGNCCAPFLRGQIAGSPIQLMRSRFSAYALGQIPYIIRTTDPEGPQWQVDLEAWGEQIDLFYRGTRFEGLEIGDAPPPVGERGKVTFTARLRQGTNDASFTEVSTFRLVSGRWLYQGGHQP